MPQRTPVIEVSHLPSAASFYAAITQPLGLQFLFTSPPGSPTCLYFGTVTDIGTSSPRKDVVFSLSQSVAAIPRLSHIDLSAASSKAALEFYKKSQLYNKGSKHNSLEHNREDGSETIIARTADFDGNMIQTAYSSRGGPRRGPSVIEMPGPEKESRRVLEWQEDVARSISGAAEEQSQVSGSTYRGPPAGPGTFRRSDTFPAAKVVHRETVTTESYRRHHGDAPERSSSGGGGISGKALIGTLLGAAAGAAVAYAMVRSESPERVSTVPAGGSGRAVSYVEGYRAPASSYTHQRRDNVVERIPARSLVSERDTQNIQPRYVAQYTIAAPPQEHLERIDERSYISHQPSRSGRSVAQSSRARSRSQEHESRYERPLQILPAAPTPRSRSPVSHVSHRSRKSKTSNSGSRSHYESVRENPDAASYHSARSTRTESTIKPSAVTYVSAAPSKAGSSHSKTTIKLMPQGGSEISVRPSQVELPRSLVSGADYAESVAPSDSVSSVGSKRERERLVGRMSRR
ncbi:uncharacterized protein BP5553_08271 [Venustampulla echinocandica]|uniref:VOC domain-containing protein n=1 Tax=Venustampulla echinocandica TaxID=2656787 RepID=A0A370TG93_9HELO|nr:uncharacterized protein BP5553_08271 [Venustampulla echinocandica]RDL33903.1 hypothetical protein BP5553_08271 [Venustampulla echinocandica]